MATQQDLQELLRLLTARKMSMLGAMQQAKALQAASLRSIQDVADAPLAAVEAALKDPKAAKSLQAACKAHARRPPKRAAGADSDGDAIPASRGSKRSKHDGHPEAGADSINPEEFERSLTLPVSDDVERIQATVVSTNRAPVVLAFAVELLRYTMPEQPLSSRLSLGQALVTANSRSKAVSLGLEKDRSAENDYWAEGQPRVTVMRRSITVLKRGAYKWKGDEAVENQSTRPAEDSMPQSSQLSVATLWLASSTISFKSSSFVAHVTALTDMSERPSLVGVLMGSKPHLGTASHNAWAARVREPGTNRIREESFDDGERGCGMFILKILREADATDTVVVLSRWFGGILLGPDRWRLMRNCINDALAQRLRKQGGEVILGGEALWGLDLEKMGTAARPSAYTSGPVVGAAVHRPESARDYLLRSFPSAPAEAASAGGLGQSPAKKAKAKKALGGEKETNLSLMLGAIRLLFDSWSDHLTAEELDQRAWGWYVAVRPDVESGPAGWGAKGLLRLRSILDLRRKG